MAPGREKVGVDALMECFAVLVLGVSIPWNGCIWELLGQELHTSLLPGHMPRWIRSTPSRAVGSQSVSTHFYSVEGCKQPFDNVIW